MSAHTRPAIKSHMWLKIPRTLPDQPFARIATAFLTAGRTTNGVMITLECDAMKQRLMVGRR